jgi:hypothetical protein
MYFNLPYHTDDVRKYKGDGDRRYVKQVFIRSAVQPHGETARLQGLKKKIFAFKFKISKFKYKRDD